MDTNPNIESALFNAIESERKIRTEKPEYFWASSLGFCPRKQICERLLMPATNPPDKRSAFKMFGGTVLHRAIQEKLEVSGYLDKTWRDKELFCENYKGKIDGFTSRIPAIVEIKTADDDAITRYKDIPEHYMFQGMWYCLASGIPDLLLFQIGKNQGLSKHQVYHLTDEWIKKLRAEMHAMNTFWQAYLRDGELPPHFHRWQWEDRYCPYQEPDIVEKMKQEARSNAVRKG